MPLETLHNGEWRPFAITHIDMCDQETEIPTTLESLKAAVSPTVRGRIQAGAVGACPWYMYASVRVDNIRERSSS